MKRITLVLFSVFLCLGLMFLPAMSAGKDNVDDSPFIAIKQLREVLPDDVTIRGDTANIYLEHIDFRMLWRNLNAIQAIEGIKGFKINKITLHLFSFGGSLFDAMAMAALLREQETSGKVVEVRARGLVASAGLIILISGTIGHRYIDSNSLLMFHELQSFKFIAIETPTDKEEEAKVYRFIQDKVNSYIASRSKMPVAELCTRIQKKEFWMNAQGAVKYGFADQVMGK